MGMGLVRVAERAAAIGATTLQIFSDNPTAWRRRMDPPPEADAFRRRLVELEIGSVAIHAAYLVNLAGPDDGLFAKSVAMVRHEVEHAPELGARFVNVHTGSHRGSGLQAGVARIVDGLERAIDGLATSSTRPETPIVVLENSAGGGAGIGSTIEELAMVLDSAGARGLGEQLAVCLDSAHLWGAGYDVANPAVIDDLLLDFDRLIGLEHLAMIHLNDSTSERGSRHDRHTHLGEGLIGREGLAHLLCHPALSHVAYYLETPGMEDGLDAVNMARIGDLAAGRPLTPVPAAFDGETATRTTRSPRLPRGRAQVTGGGESA
jgi:deoxyribonuclease-4